MNRVPHWSSVLPALVIPVCLGMSMYLGFAVAIERGWIADETTLRYLTGHPISKVTLALFLIGMGSLTSISLNVFAQFRRLDEIVDWFRSWESGSSDADAASQGTETDPSDAPGEIPEEANPVWQADYLACRLEEIGKLRTQNCDRERLDEELKYLSDIDHERQSQRYALVRILIWATPMLGFLGTVLGISQALGGITVGPDNDFGQMLNGLRASLFVAFDTTALALVLSMVLMFAQFFVDRFETQLIEVVDHRCRPFARPLETTSAVTDPEKPDWSEAILESNRQLVLNQTELWRETIQSAEKAWIETLTSASEEVQVNLTEAIDESVGNLADYLGQAISRADDALDRRWQQWQTALSENARQLHAQQKEMCRHTELMAEWTERAFPAGSSTAAVKAAAETAKPTDTGGVAEESSIDRATPPEAWPESAVASEMSADLETRATEREASESSPVRVASVRRMGPDAWRAFQQSIEVDTGLEQSNPNPDRDAIYRFPQNRAGDESPEGIRADSKKVA